MPHLKKADWDVGEGSSGSGPRYGEKFQATEVGEEVGNKIKAV